MYRGAVHSDTNFLKQNNGVIIGSSSTAVEYNRVIFFLSVPDTHVLLPTIIPTTTTTTSAHIFNFVKCVACYSVYIPRQRRRRDFCVKGHNMCCVAALFVLFLFSAQQRRPGVFCQAAAEEARTDRETLKQALT